ncbi:MAG: HTTM domain-containing protein, partial [Vicingaceae bacterium]|nr:HTTM domain-containing protein [Vicingaceae bacterium]
TYFFLLDKSYYNNHLYLFSLISFLLIFIPADGAFSLKGKKKVKPLLGWHLRILQFQFIVVYFFGGVAKINGDWLFYYEPITTLLKNGNYYSEGLALFLAFSGLLFDLFIGFLLLIKKTRIYAFVFALAFNITNHVIFDDINIFPFFMMASLVLFFELEKFTFLSKFNKFKEEDVKIIKSPKPVLYLIGVFVLFQLFMPLRHYLIPGNVDWTGEGHRFAWRMKIQTRTINECEFAIFDLKTKTIYPVKINNHIHDIQKYFMIHYPKMILDFAHYLEEYAKKERQMNNVMIKAKINVRFNQRESVEILSPNIDLTKEKWNSFGHNEWINSL